MEGHWFWQAGEDTWSLVTYYAARTEVSMRWPSPSTAPPTISAAGLHTYYVGAGRNGTGKGTNITNPMKGLLDSMSESLDHIFSFLENMEFYDIYIPGYMERDGNFLEFIPWEYEVFVYGDGNLLSMSSCRNHGQVRIKTSKEIEIPEEIKREGFEFAVGSVGNQFLLDSLPSYKCTRVRYVTDSESSLDEAIVKCIELEFENRYILFIDPEWHFGLRLSGGGYYEHWINFYHSHDKDNLKEHMWNS